MSMFANPQENYKEWDFIQGDFNWGIGRARNDYLTKLNSMSNNEMQIALKDPEPKDPKFAWTKWKSFYGSWDLLNAFDVHRSMLKNEVVVESDYKSYDENLHAMRQIGAILEDKNFKPSYYYSGSKSIHCHLFIDFSSLRKADGIILAKIPERFRFPGLFRKKFIEWLREKIITGWGLDIGEFDKDLINSKHLIRSELSRNKFGYKTFLGNSYKELETIPQICNPETQIRPKIGDIRLSELENPTELLEEFFHDIDQKKKKKEMDRQSISLSRWTDPHKLRPSVQFMLSNEFKQIGDGKKRAMFILANELKRIFGPNEALNMLRDWNLRMDAEIRDEEMVYRVGNKDYCLTDDYIEGFLESIKCDRKLYKDG